MSARIEGAPTSWRPAGQVEQTLERVSTPRVKDLEEERRGYLGLAAQGRVADHDLDALLSEVEKQRDSAQWELRRAVGSKERLRALTHRRELVLKLWKQLDWDRSENVNSEERMRWYERPHITAVPTEDGENLQLRGLLDNVGRTDENEIPSVAPSDKRPKLAFRVTLGEDSREVELSLS